jgi:hypothetical protein
MLQCSQRLAKIRATARVLRPSAQTHMEFLFGPAETMRIGGADSYGIFMR